MNVAAIGGSLFGGRRRKERKRGDVGLENDVALTGDFDNRITTDGRRGRGDARYTTGENDSMMTPKVNNAKGYNPTSRKHPARHIRNDPDPFHQHPGRENNQARSASDFEALFGSIFSEGGEGNDGSGDYGGGHEHRQDEDDIADKKHRRTDRHHRRSPSTSIPASTPVAVDNTPPIHMLSLGPDLYDDAAYAR